LNFRIGDIVRNDLEIGVFLDYTDHTFDHHSGYNMFCLVVNSRLFRDGVLGRIVWHLVEGSGYGDLRKWSKDEEWTNDWL